MRFFVLSWNGECHIVRFSRVAPASEINRVTFGIPYGPKWLGSNARLPLAIGIAREAGFKEAVIDGQKQGIQIEDVAGVI